MKTTGEILKEYRDRNSITARDLADKIGVSQTFYTKIENNKSKVSEKVLEVLRILLPKEEYLGVLEYEDYRNTPNFIRKEITALHMKEMRKKRKVISEVGEIPYFPDINASAGTGCLNEEVATDEYIEVPKKYAKLGHIAIRVSGDSMYPEIQDEDVVVINTCSKECMQKRIMVVNYQDELYIKKIFMEDDKIFLQSTNPFYKPIEVEADELFYVVGQVVHLERFYN